MKRTLILMAALTALLFLSGCKVGRPPLGIAWITAAAESGDTAVWYCSAGYDDDEELVLGEPIELPFGSPTDFLAFTPEGNRLWAWSVHDDGTPGLFSLDFEGDLPAAETVFRLDLSGYPAAEASSIDIEPEAVGGRVWFDARDPESGHWQIFLLDGDSLTQFTHGNASYEVPTISPDGKLLVFSTNDDGTGEAKEDYDLWLCDLEIGSMAPLITTEANEGSPRFAPDDSFFYVSGEDGFDLFWTKLKGEPVSLGDFGGLELFPRPSPDGRLLLFTAKSDDRWMSHIYNLKEDIFTPLAEDDAEVIFATWR
ncbi:hypothetical protein K8R78_08055 [bacterium]|nr:hypothetical protein [bacterium]